MSVIRYSIERNLSIAIANYNNYSGVTTNFQMPELKENEWEKILNNISIISFLQGLNIGGKIYNGYSIITNTKNQEVVSEDSIYITTSDGYYHKPNEKNFEDSAKNNYSVGIFNVDFERKSISSDIGNTYYYYPRKELASYSSIVNQSNLYEINNIYDYLSSSDKARVNGGLAEKYFTALARERYGMYKTNNNSEKLKSQFMEE